MSDGQKEELGLAGREWVEKPMKRIDFHVGKNSNGRGGGFGGRGRGNKSRGQGRKGQMDKARQVNGAY